ncbi:MAG: PKD domain-containing protein [Flavobacteriaceae bacterium]|nr:PKD domain-containing protein [Flavobacteriaceae bacterium]
MINKNQNIQHLDRSIILLLIVFFFVFGFVFFIKVIKNSNCDEISFEIKAQRFVVGELIQFHDKTNAAETWYWEFGDKTSASSKEALHIYKKPGEYTINLKVNNNCETSKTIFVEEKSIIIDSTKFPVFKLPLKIRLGRTLYVEDQTKNATSWEWRFGETSSANATTKKAKYNFKSPGLKTVSLIVNGNLDYITKKRIEVLPELDENTSKVEFNRVDLDKGLKKSPTIVPFIDDVEFANKLLLVSQGKMSPKQFTKYFCGELNKSIIVNKKSTKFLLFCEKIFDKKIKIKKIELFRDDGSNCINTFTIDYKKGWF